MQEKLPQNTIHEQTSDMPQESVGKISVEQSEDLKQTTDTLSKMTEDIQDGVGITKEDITKLKDEMDNIPVQLGPYHFSAKRLLELSKEDLEEQAKVLQEISEGDFDNTGRLKIINAEVPLAEMFGYATALRSATQGRATFTMEFKQYAEAPSNIADAIIKRA